MEDLGKRAIRINLFPYQNLRLTICVVLNKSSDNVKASIDHSTQLCFKRMLFEF